MDNLHFLRPWWFLAIIPFVICLWRMWRYQPKSPAWEDICDPRLLAHLAVKKGNNKRLFSFAYLMLSILFMIMSLTGPCWHQLPTVTFKQLQPRVLVLDLSKDMMQTDLTPNRLSRAKFKLHDVLNQKDIGQIGLVVYTGEPFIVSPLTDDGKTISSLLNSLSADIMPVSGNNLTSALEEAKRLIKQAGYVQGQILVLTATTPTADAMDKASTLAGEGIDTSIMPIRSGNDLNPLFNRFAQAGRGQVITYAADNKSLQSWLTFKNKDQYTRALDQDIPLWRDEGRWFLIPALLFLLPAFRRGWLQRVSG